MTQILLIEYNRNMDWEIKQLTDRKLPNRLKEIPKPPETMFLVGELPDPDYFIYLTVVGSRRFSDYGRAVCQKLIAGLSGQPFCIVSGLALGIDSIAHREAIENGLPTVAVPGSGLSEKVLYPRTNLNLARKIIKVGGGLLSEFPPELSATPYTFPQRNRIMAGLSQATLVIEAQEKSGTLITARLALDYNREVLTIPGSIFQTNNQGTNNLLKQGATPITKSDDILEVFGLETQAVNSDENLLKEILSPEEKIVYDLIITNDLTRDEICLQSKLETHIVNITLSQMEVRGLIKEMSGKFSRA